MGARKCQQEIRQIGRIVMTDKTNHRRKNKAPRVYVELDIESFSDIIKPKEKHKFDKNRNKKKKPYKNGKKFDKNPKKDGNKSK